MAKRKTTQSVKRVPKTATEVIILNKPFSGGWLNGEGHIAHEIVDFLRDDHGNQYIYGLHSGSCPKEIWVGEVNDEPVPNKGALIRGKDEPLKRIKQEKCAARYLVLTSAADRKEKKGFDTFDILYVVELAEKLHRMTGCDKKTNEEKWHQNIKTSKRLVKNLDIKYNGKLLNDCFDPDWDILVTYRAGKIYEAKERISFALPYKWRNKGYVWNKRIGKNGKEYVNQNFKKLERTIEGAIANSSLVEFDAKQVCESEFREEKFRNLEGKSTFLDILSLQDYEQAYTNMLYAVLRVDNGNMMKKFCYFMQAKGKLPKSAFDINQWKDVKVQREKSSKEDDKKESLDEEEVPPDAENKGKNGRMDVCAEIKDGETLIQRVVIENKIDSGLNGRDKGKMISQLNTYYKWGSGGDLNDENRPSRKKPLCMIIAPTYRIEELEWEIKEIDKKQTSHKDKMLREDHSKYHILTYGDVADFIDKFDKEIGKEIDPAFVEQFSQSFRAHSLEKKDDYAWRFFLETKKAFSRQ